MSETKLSDLCALPTYRQQRENVFPSEGSLQWFVRTHRDDLVRRGALLMLAGQWRIHVERFDAYVLEAGQAAALKRSGDA